MIVSKQLRDFAAEMCGPMLFGEAPDAESIRRMLQIVGDLVPESPEDEQIKRDLYEQGKAELAKIEADK